MKYLKIFLLLLISINLFLVYFLKQNDNIISNLKNEVYYLNRENEVFKTKIGLFRKYFINQHAFDDIVLNNMTLTDYKDEKTSVSSLINNSPVFVVVRFTEFNCNVCVDTLVKHVSKMKMKYKYIKVVFLCSFNNQRNFTIFSHKNSDKYIFQIEDMSLPFDSYHLPYIFTIDNSLVPKHIFFSNEGFPEMIDDYFAFINSRYYSSN